MDPITPAALRTFSLTSREYVEHPYPFCNAFLQHHPVFHSQTDDCFIVSRYEDVKHVLSDFETFSSDSGVLQKRVDRKEDYGFSPIFMMAPPAQTRLRKLAAPAFSMSSAQELESGIARAAQQLLQRHATSPTIDVVHDYAMPLVIEGIVRLLNVQGEAGVRLAAIIEAITTRGDRSQSEDTSFFNEDEQQKGLMRAVADHYPTLAGANACPFAQRLMSPDREGDRLTDRESIGMLYVTAIAGVEDAIRSIANVLVALWENRVAREAVLRDPQEWIGSAIMEALRLYPSSHFVRRTATRDVEIAGVHIPAGSNVVALIAAANRDPAQFKDPERFDLKRLNVKSAMSFGAGPHVCIGQHIGRTIVKAVLLEFLKCAPDYRLNLTQSERSCRGMIVGYRKLIAHKAIGAPREATTDVTGAVLPAFYAAV